MVEEIKEPARKLASIQVITAISPIEGADRVEVARVLDWECVVKKGDFKIGDKVIYFECDSILPERPEFEFLRERKFRIKIIKLRKQISQGLIMPLNIISDMNFKDSDIGLDITEKLGVRKHDPQLKEENDLVGSQKNRSPILKFFMNFAPFRFVYFKLFGKIKGNWPEWISKTDENRIQTCARKLMDHYNEEWYITEKLDGQSCTVFTYNKKVWGLWKKHFGVCSRNIWLKSKSKNNYWEMVDKYNLQNKLMGEKEIIIIQGEICGPGIQKNKYKLENKELFVYNIFKDGIQLSLEDMIIVCQEMGLKTVPVEQYVFSPYKMIGGDKETSDVVKYMIKYSEGNSKLLKRKREGVVVRLRNNPAISFKVINPQFLLEEKDDGE